MAKMSFTWLILQLTAVVIIHLNTVGADECLGGSNIFTELPENSPNGSFVVNLTGFGNSSASSVQLCLGGIDAHWFYLDGKTIRLNVSTEKTLDREALNPPILVVTLYCSEDSLPTVEYRVMIQVLNENDHQPHFQGEPLISQNISELTTLHSVVFTVQAEDGDGDSLIYSINNTFPDAIHFRIDLPNSGRVVLAQPLDFEAKHQLEVVIHAMEVSTRERYKCTTTVYINVLDGDDQYPSFLPCHHLSLQDYSHVCISPIYTANVTEGETPEGPLHFQPGAIYAEDGDHDLKAALSYSILEGADGDRFHMDNTTGVLTMQKEAPSSQLTSAFHLTVMVRTVSPRGVEYDSKPFLFHQAGLGPSYLVYMGNKPLIHAAQVNDPRKYAVSKVLVRVLAVNHHPPCFSLPHYTAFVSEGTDTATLLVTYGGRVLSLHAEDPDFPSGINPNLWYKILPEGNHSQLFSVTRDGLILARPNQLREGQTYFLQVTIQDEESGEVANTTVGVEVLPLGQAVPPDPSEISLPQSAANRIVVVGGLTLAVLFLGAGFGLGMWALRRWQQHQEFSKQMALADEKHPNVLLLSQRLKDQVQDGKLSTSPESFYSPQNEPEALSSKGTREERAQRTGSKGPLSPSSRDETITSLLPNGKIPDPVMTLGASWLREPSQMTTENTGIMIESEVMLYQGERTVEDHLEKPAGDTQIGGNGGSQEVASVSNYTSREEINSP